MTGSSTSHPPAATTTTTTGGSGSKRAGFGGMDAPGMTPGGREVRVGTPLWPCRCLILGTDQGRGARLCCREAGRRTWRLDGVARWLQVNIRGKGGGREAGGDLGHVDMQRLTRLGTRMALSTRLVSPSIMFRRVSASLDKDTEASPVRRLLTRRKNQWPMHLDATLEEPHQSIADLHCLLSRYFKESMVCQGGEYSTTRNTWVRLLG